MTLLLQTIYRDNMSLFDRKFDCIVVGSGIIGTFTSFHLSKRGNSVLLIDQFHLPHENGSSKGNIRGFELSCGFPAPAILERFAMDSLQIWKELQATTDKKLFAHNELLYLGPNTDPMIQRLLSSMKEANQPYLEYLGNTKCTSRYSKMNIPGEFVGVLDTSALLLFADKILHALREEVLKGNGLILDNTKMTDITTGDTVTVHTDKGCFLSKSLVLAVGPWGPTLPNVLELNSLFKLKVEMVSVGYWYEDASHKDAVTKDMKMPSVVETVNGKPLWVNGTKECMKIVYSTNKDVLANDLPAYDDTEALNEVKKHINERFPFLEALPRTTEKCIYTISPDSTYILDYHMEWKNIVLGLGMSGYGFALAPVIGKILSDLAVGNTLEYDITPFQCSRFVQ